MPSTILPSEKKRKSSSKKKSRHGSLPGEPVKGTKKKSRSSNRSKGSVEDETHDDLTIDTDSKIKEVTDAEDVSDANQHLEEVPEESEEQANGLVDSVDDKVSDGVDKVKDVTGETGAKAQDQVSNDDSDDDEAATDMDALTTMNGIMEYNRILVQRLHDMEGKTGKLSKENIQDSVQDTMDEVSAKYSTAKDNKGTNHSFELPIGDMMKGYGNFSSTPLPEEGPKPKKIEDEETTVKGDGDGNTHIGDGEKDDIVVKVEATKTGITFSIHIPRN